MEFYEKTISDAFADPNNLAFKLPDVEVNGTIRRSYDVDVPFTYTLTQLWDMEVKKAYNPEKYLKPVVRIGSLKVFNVVKEGPTEQFIRVSDQKMWKDPSQFTTVIERVCIDHNAHKVFFLGTPEIEGPDGEKIVAGTGQPLFHVEHTAFGAEKEPLNGWRIVHLAEGKEQKEISAFFEMISKSPFLPPYNEVYIREDLGKRLDKKDLGITH